MIDTIEDLETSVETFMESKLNIKFEILRYHTKEWERMKYLRLRHLIEELGEFAVAQSTGDEAEIADALGDLLYILVGTFLTYDMPISPIMEEIHRSNMTKDALGDNHKGGKGSNFEPPRLAEVLADVRRR